MNVLRTHSSHRVYFGVFLLFDVALTLFLLCLERQNILPPWRHSNSIVDLLRAAVNDSLLDVLVLSVLRVSILLACNVAIGWYSLVPVFITTIFSTIYLVFKSYISIIWTTTFILVMSGTFICAWVELLMWVLFKLIRKEKEKEGRLLVDLEKYENESLLSGYPEEGKRMKNFSVSYPANASESSLSGYKHVQHDPVGNENGYSVSSSLRDSEEEDDEDFGVVYSDALPEVSSSYDDSYTANSSRNQVPSLSAPISISAANANANAYANSQTPWYQQGETACHFLMAALRERASYSLVYEKSGVQVFRQSGDDMLRFQAQGQIKASARTVLETVLDIKRRHQWDTNFKTIELLEAFDEHHEVFHMTTKRIWPAAARDVLFLRTSQAWGEDGGFITVGSSWKEHSYSVPLPSGTIRVDLICGGFYIVPLPDNPRCCDVSYVSVVNPGGWLPDVLVSQATKQQLPGLYIGLRKLCE
jgi:hypothetical protein